VPFTYRAAPAAQRQLCQSSAKAGGNYTLKPQVVTCRLSSWKRRSLAPLAVQLQLWHSSAVTNTADVSYIVTTH
jgi:hypothetical protein